MPVASQHFLAKWKRYAHEYPVMTTGTLCVHTYFSHDFEQSGAPAAQHFPAMLLHHDIHDFLAMPFSNGEAEA